MRQIFRASFLLVVACGALAAAGPAWANSTTGSGAPVVLHPSFHRVGPGPTEAFASGDYLTYPTTVGPGPSFMNTGWIVINDRLGTTTALDPQCDVVALGPPWVLMSCPQTSAPGGYDLELYSLTDGARQTVTPSPGLPQCPSGPFSGEKCSAPVGVGAYWIRWDASCYHCVTASFFQNIQTGELRDDPTNATTYADLNSPALAHMTCPGVRVIRNPFPFGSGEWGSLTPYGQFALATDPRDGGSTVLERCGTRMRRLLFHNTFSGAASAGAIVWPAPSGLTGLFLPSLQTFTIALPSAIAHPPGASIGGGGVLGLELTSGGLYLEDTSRTSWRAASPTDLPLNASRPRVMRSGSTLTCRRGSWRNAERFSYAWRVNGVPRKGANLTLTIGKARKPRTASCSVTASNASGTTTASSAQLRVARTPPRRS